MKVFELSSVLVTKVQIIKVLLYLIFLYTEVYLDLNKYFLNLACLFVPHATRLQMRTNRLKRERRVNFFSTKIKLVVKESIK